MKVIWLGQAGLLFENENVKIMIDPYLSDSCGKINPKSKRRVPVDKKMLKINPDIIICTHNHLDHLDLETLQHYLTEDSTITVMCSENGFPEVRKFSGNNNYVMMHPGTEWTEKGIKFTAVSAEHSELSALGIIIDDGEKKYYITGDTLYNKNIFAELPSDIYAIFLPINGKGNNMNMTDAARFAKEVGAKRSVPLHWGLFDNIDPTGFDAETAVIPKMYQEINL